MKVSLRAVLAGLAGLAFAVGLTLGAWAIVGGDLAEPVRPVRAPGELSPTRHETPRPSASADASPSPTESDDDGGHRQRGKGSGRSGGDD